MIFWLAFLGLNSIVNVFRGIISIEVYLELSENFRDTVKFFHEFLMVTLDLNGGPCWYDLGHLNEYFAFGPVFLVFSEVHVLFEEFYILKMLL